PPPAQPPRRRPLPIEERRTQSSGFDPRRPACPPPPASLEMIRTRNSTKRSPKKSPGPEPRRPPRPAWVSLRSSIVRPYSRAAIVVSAALAWSRPREKSFCLRDGLTSSSRVAPTRPSGRATSTTSPVRAKRCTSFAPVAARDEDLPLLPRQRPDDAAIVPLLADAPGRAGARREVVDHLALQL